MGTVKIREGVKYNKIYSPSEVLTNVIKDDIYRTYHLGGSR